MQYDTIVTNFTQATNVTADDVVNATEAEAGFQISGTVEPNSDVVVTLASGAVQTVHAGADGLWSVTFGASDLVGQHGHDDLYGRRDRSCRQHVGSGR